MSKAEPIFPKMCDLADEASGRAQKTYVTLNVAQLVLLAASALVAGMGAGSVHSRRLSAVIVCSLMFVALAVWLALKIGAFDVRWFKCRAFAENAKSIVWQYVMAGDKTEQPRELAYVNEWVALQKRLPELQSQFSLCEGSTELVTDWMQKVATGGLATKVATYKERRLNDQRRWYTKNSRHNGKLHAIWFWAIFVAQFGVIVIAAIQAFTLFEQNFVGFVASVVTCGLAWTQLKRFSDLATTYAVAAEDLNQIATKFSVVTDQATLDALVAAVEEAVSREHNLWLTRRVSC